MNTRPVDVRVKNIIKDKDSNLIMIKRSNSSRVHNNPKIYVPNKSAPKTRKKNDAKHSIIISDSKLKIVKMFM